MALILSVAKSDLYLGLEVSASGVRVVVNKSFCF